MCDKCVRICDAIGQLNINEGSSVTILAPNADFDGSSHAIEVDGEWTNWQPLRFHGETVLEALEKSVIAMKLIKL